MRITTFGPGPEDKIIEDAWRECDIALLATGNAQEKANCFAILEKEGVDAHGVFPMCAVDKRPQGLLTWAIQNTNYAAAQRQIEHLLGAGAEVIYYVAETPSVAFPVMEERVRGADEAMERARATGALDERSKIWRHPYEEHEGAGREIMDQGLAEEIRGYLADGVCVGLASAQDTLWNGLYASIVEDTTINSAQSPNLLRAYHDFRLLGCTFDGLGNALRDHYLSTVFNPGIALGWLAADFTLRWYTEGLDPRGAWLDTWLNEQNTADTGYVATLRALMEENKLKENAPFIGRSLQGWLNSENIRQENGRLTCEESDRRSQVIRVPHGFFEAPKLTERRS